MYNFFTFFRISTIMCSNSTIQNTCVLSLLCDLIMQVGTMDSHSENDVTSSLPIEKTAQELRDEILTLLIDLRSRENTLQSMIHPNDDFTKEILAETLSNLHLCIDQITIAYECLDVEVQFYFDNFPIDEENEESDNHVTSTQRTDLSHKQLRDALFIVIEDFFYKNNVVQSLIDNHDFFSKKTLAATVCNLNTCIEQLNIASGHLDVASRSHILN